MKLRNWKAGDKQVNLLHFSKEKTSIEKCFIRISFCVISMEGAFPHFRTICGDASNKLLSIYLNMQEVILRTTVKTTPEMLFRCCTSGANYGFQRTVSRTIRKLQIRIPDINANNIHYMIP